jgi:hypothetical protein
MRAARGIRGKGVLGENQRGNVHGTGYKTGYETDMVIPGTSNGRRFRPQWRFNV